MHKLLRILKSLKEVNKSQNILKTGLLGKTERIFTKRDVEKYISLSGDENPVHSICCEDDTLLVHGSFVSGMISNVIGNSMPGAVLLNQVLEFENPVFTGEQIVCEALVLEVDEKGRKFVIETKVFGKEDKEIRITGQAEVHWMFTNSSFDLH